MKKLIACLVCVLVLVSACITPGAAGAVAALAAEGEQNSGVDFSISQVAPTRPVVEKTAGGYNEIDQFYEYYFTDFEPVFVVNINREMKGITPEELFTYGYSYSSTSDQGPENEWGVGENHIFRVTVYNSDKSVYGNFNCGVSITENPIESFTVTAKNQLVEKVGGDFNDAGHYEYDFESFEPEFTVTLKNGGTETIPYAQLYNRFGFYYDAWSDQSAKNEWGQGDHEFTVKLGSLTASCAVTVTENPIESFTVAVTNRVTEKTGGYFNAAGYYEYSFFAFNPMFTVKLKTGAEETVPAMYLQEKYGFSYSTVDSQQQGEWGVGKHPVTVIFAGLRVNCEVEITENPITDFTVTARKKVVLKTGGDYHGYYEYHFESFEPEFTVTLKNGETETVSAQDFYNKFGFNYSTGSDQSAENEWGEGAHAFTVNVAGITKSCTVTVTKNNFKSITATATKQLVEYSLGYYNGSFHGYSFTDFEPVFTVTYEDDEGNLQTKSASYNMFYSTFGVSITEKSNQSDENVWGVGEHEFTVEAGGLSCICKVTITESPIKTVTVNATRPLIENTGGYNNNGFYEYYFYSFKPQFTVTLKNGQVKTVSADDFYNEFGVNAFASSNQTSQNPWRAGKHEFTVFVTGKNYSCPVLVVETPVKELKASLKRAVPPNEWYSGEYFCFEVTFKNGQTQKFEDFGFRFGQEYGLDITDFKNTEPGNYKTRVSFLGVTAELAYTVAESPYTVQISGENELFITLKNGDKTEQHKVVAYEDRGAGFGSGYGVMKTDKGEEFVCYSEWYCPEENEENEDLTRDFQLTLFGQKSNKLNGFKWFKAQNKLSTLYDFSLTFDSKKSFAYNGAVTAENVDAVLSVALYPQWWDTEGVFELETAKAAVEKYFALNGFDLTTAKCYNKQTGKFLLPPYAMNDIGLNEITYAAGTGWTFTHQNSDGTVDTLVLGENGLVQKMAFNQQSTAGHKHQFSAAESVDGNFHSTACAECGRFELSAHHFHGVTVRKAPTATANGTRVGYCSECNKEVEAPIYAAEFEHYDLSGNGELDLADAARLAQYLAGWYGNVPANCDYNEDGEVTLKEAVLLMRLILNS